MPNARLKELRKKSKMTQRQLAEAAGINRRSYQNIEYGKLSSSHMALVNLAKIFGVSIDYLLGSSDESTEQ